MSQKTAENHTQELEFELVDLEKHDLPFCADPSLSAYNDELVEKEKLRPWTSKLDSLDAIILSFPGIIKGFLQLRKMAWISSTTN